MNGPRALLPVPPRTMDVHPGRKQCNACGTAAPQ